MREAISRLQRPSAAKFAEKVDLGGTAPKGAFDFEQLTASLKRCPDTKPSFSALTARLKPRPFKAVVNKAFPIICEKSSGPCGFLVR
jgi:hypothetical protein